LAGLNQGAKEMNEKAPVNGDAFSIHDSNLLFDLLGI